jgi:hypothetical protein
VLGGVDGNLHFPVPFMNRLNQTEPATFSILPCWAFFRDSIFIYFIWRLSWNLQCDTQVPFQEKWHMVHQVKKCLCPKRENNGRACLQPSLQHFRFCRVGLSLGILILSHSNALSKAFQYLYHHFFWWCTLQLLNVPLLNTTTDHVVTLSDDFRGLF